MAVTQEATYFVHFLNPLVPLQEVLECLKSKENGFQKEYATWWPNNALN